MHADTWTFFASQKEGADGETAVERAATGGGEREVERRVEGDDGATGSGGEADTGDSRCERASAATAEGKDGNEQGQSGRCERDADAVPEWRWAEVLNSRGMLFGGLEGSRLSVDRRLICTSK